MRSPVTKAIFYVIQSLLSTFLVSVFLFFVGYWVVTKEFPPNIRKIEASFEKLKELRKMQTALMEENETVAALKAHHPIEQESDTELLTNNHSAQMESAHESLKKLKNSEPERLNQLELTVLKLQNRVAELEANQAQLVKKLK